MIIIYHNPRCRKSREGLQIIEDSGKSFEIIKYLETPLSKDELTEIINKLDISPEGLVRKSETIWKSEFKGKALSDNEIIDAMVNNPKLIERPIVISDKGAVIGRPPSNINSVI